MKTYFKFRPALYVTTLCIMLMLCGCRNENKYWIDAYYQYMLENDEGYNTYITLVDLDFDDVPELFGYVFEIGLEQTTSRIDWGITYKEGEVVPLRDVPPIKYFLGTKQGADGEILWCIQCNPILDSEQYTVYGIYDFSDIPTIKQINSTYLDMENFADEEVHHALDDFWAGIEEQKTAYIQVWDDFYWADVSRTVTVKKHTFGRTSFYDRLLRQWVHS